jgi:hypothetical protein
VTILRVAVIGMLLTGIQRAAAPAGSGILRAPPHLLRSDVREWDNEASAVARGGCSTPATQPTKPRLPALTFPEPGLDDTASYQGYQTRFYRDSKDNTVQIYIEPKSSRVVLVWADAANESAAFTVHDARGRPPRVTWGADRADVSESGATRTIEYTLNSDVSRIELGSFVLGSMRVERDFVYARRHLQPFTAPPFRVAEESLIVADVSRLPPGERARHLELLRADNVETLRARLEPTVTSTTSDSVAEARVVRPSLDGRNRLALELRVDPRKMKMSLGKGTVVLSTRPGQRVSFRVRVTTDADPLTPLSRTQIFKPVFLQFLESTQNDSSPGAKARYRRLERQVTGVELLSSKEKLMAGLPNFATYFGRDMMMTALMMRPIWNPEMAEHVIASVLRKLGPRGDVSHEEALGGQAIRESAADYSRFISEYLRTRESSSLAEARRILENLQTTRENYHMIDDEFQLPVLAALYLADSAVPAARKRAFLTERSQGSTHFSLMLREFAHVARLAEPYVSAPHATNLVSFPRRDTTHWRSASWRDSDAGYAGGRYAMDINAIWVPAALESLARMLAVLPTLGIRASDIDSMGQWPGDTPVPPYTRDSTGLQHAIEVWKGARRHFEVRLSPAALRRHINAKLAWLRAGERRYWQGVIARHPGVADSLTFLAVALDAAGRPIPVVNTDPATELFLADTLSRDRAEDDLAPVLRPYPAGLFIDSLGPVVANDVYASRATWDRFRADAYHGPRVVWGREVNLLLLGVANRIAEGRDASGQLRDALRRIAAAVNASGLQHNELWSYEIRGRTLKPVRYGTSSDVQLWNTTNLVVQYVLLKLPE